MRSVFCGRWFGLLVVRGFVESIVRPMEEYVFILPLIVENTTKKVSEATMPLKSLLHKTFFNEQKRIFEHCRKAKTI